MPWYYAVAERDHDLQNPTSPEKIRQLGELLRLGPDSRVLDVACGMGGPAMVLAATFGCTVLGVERSPDFVAWGRERIAAAGLADRIEIVEGDASAYPIEQEAWDAALCLGATFVFRDLTGTIAALAPAVKAGGRLAVGEPFWLEWPLPRDVDDLGYVPLEETVARFTAPGLALTGLIESSRDDWDRYESLHWRALDEYLAGADDPEIRERYEHDRRQYLEQHRRLLSWAIFVARRPGPAPAR
jgi:SAM-dependent methyltransferase